MKSKLMKVFMPLVVITLGVFGALSTSAMNQRTAAIGDEWGYSHIEGENCVREIMCSTLPGTPCKTVAGVPLFKLQNAVSCPNPLNIKK